jgi:hypothetical protein
MMTEHERIQDHSKKQQFQLLAWTSQQKKEEETPATAL